MLVRGGPAGPLAAAIVAQDRPWDRGCPPATTASPSSPRPAVIGSTPHPLVRPQEPSGTTVGLESLLIVI